MLYNTIKKNRCLIMKALFFTFIYVLLGTLGVTVPLIVHQEFIPSEFAIGLVTVAMSYVGYNASEKILESFDKKPRKKITLFLYVLSLIIILIITLLVCIRITQDKQSDTSNNLALYFSIGAYVISCIIWWVQNWDNKNFENTSSTTLGGDIRQFNK